MNYSQAFIGKKINIEIDRPLGSHHPKHKDIIYKTNYGYVPNTKAPDGEEIDAYLLGVLEPVTKYEGICIAIIHRLNDNDDKLIVVPEGKNYSDDEIRNLTEYQEKYFKSEIIRNP
ncbi:MAG: inorganic diphosphatase [Candidatus Nanoarchaeia archaeon]